MSEGGDRWGGLDLDLPVPPAPPATPASSTSPEPLEPLEPSPRAKAPAPPARMEMEVDPLAPAFSFELAEIEPPPPREQPSLRPAADPARAEPSVASPAARNAVTLEPAPPPPKGKAYFCDHCRLEVAPADALQSRIEEAMVAVPICARCRRTLRLEDTGPSRPIALVLFDAIAWPLYRDNVFSLLAQALVLWFLGSVASLLGLLGLIVNLAATGILAMHVAAILRESAEGEDTMPGPADAVSSSSLILPVFRHLLVFFVASVPLFVLLVFAARLTVPARNLLALLAMVFFCLYVPAGQIIVATRPSFLAALNPIPPILFAVYAGKDYLVACAILIGFVAVHAVLMLLVVALAVTLFGEGTGVVAVTLRGLLVTPVTVWGFFVIARMLGLVVFERRHAVALV